MIQRSSMKDSVSVTLGRALMTIRVGSRMSRQKLADLVGVHHNTIQKLEMGDRTVTVEWLRKIAPHLGTTVDEIMTLAGFNHDKRDTLSLKPSDKAPDNIPNGVGLLGAWRQDLRVLGFASGPGGWPLFTGELVEMTIRPPNLVGVEAAYAVYVQRNTMEPRYFLGELAWIHPGRPVGVGDFVFVQLQPEPGESAPRAIIKRLVSRSDSKIVLEQYSPAKRIDFKPDAIKSMHLVVGSGKL